MQTIYNWQEQEHNKIKEKTIFTIGSFDGLHLGHKKIINNITKKANKLNCNSLILTFNKHPLSVLYPSVAPELLTTLKTKENILKNWGIKTFGVINFNEEIAQLSPDFFLKNLIEKFINPIEFISGEDFTFGFNAEGNISYLKNWGLKNNIKITTIKKQNSIKTGYYSSSQIRANIKTGLISATNNSLARLYQIKGVITKGEQIGRTLGYPTANLKNIEELIPAPGVYATTVFINNKFYQSVTSISNNPTFNRKKLTVETNIFNFNEDIYEKELTVFFIKKIRDTIKFKSIKALIEQIGKDKELTLKNFTKENKLLEETKKYFKS